MQNVTRTSVTAYRVTYHDSFQFTKRPANAPWTPEPCSTR